MKDVNIPAARYEFFERIAEGELTFEMPAISGASVSEYFFYTPENILPDSISLRIQAFRTGDITSDSVPEYGEEKYEKVARLFLGFLNRKKGRCGREPLPEGKIFGFQKNKGNIKYPGSDNVRYIPTTGVCGRAQGKFPESRIEKDYMTESFTEDKYGEMSGYGEIRDYKIEVNNYSPLTCTLEIKEHYDGDRKIVPGEVFERGYSNSEYRLCHFIGERKNN